MRMERKRTEREKEQEKQVRMWTDSGVRNRNCLIEKRKEKYFIHKIILHTWKLITPDLFSLALSEFSAAELN